MNIFVLDENPEKAASMLCDKHVVKMLLESAQMLCSVFPPGTAPYRRTHYNHPCTQWVRESQGNYRWLLTHAKAQAREYSKRYLRRHKSEDVVDWCEKNCSLLEFPKKGQTPFVLCMPAQYKTKFPVASYRLFYINEKYSFAEWNKLHNEPKWWPYES